MKKQRKHYTPEEKVAILRRHLLEQVPISELCGRHGLQPTVFYRWQKEFFENGAAAFQPKARLNHSAEQERVAYLEKKIQTKGRGPGGTDGRACRAKKPSWGTLTGVWVPHDTRDQIVDFVRRWSEKTEISAICAASWTAAADTSSTGICGSR
jgi:transposase